MIVSFFVQEIGSFFIYCFFMDLYYMTVAFYNLMDSTFFVVAVFSSFWSFSYLIIGVTGAFYAFPSVFLGKGFYFIYTSSSSYYYDSQSYSLSRGMILISLLLYCVYSTVSGFVFVSQCVQVLFCTGSQSSYSAFSYIAVSLFVSASMMFTTITCYGIFCISIASYFATLVVTMELSATFLSLLSERSVLSSFFCAELTFFGIFAVVLLAFTFKESGFSETAFTISVVLLCGNIYLAFFYYIACLCNFSQLLSYLSLFSRTSTMVYPLFALVSVTLMDQFDFFEESVAFIFNTSAVTGLAISSPIVVVEFNEVGPSCFLLICLTGFSSAAVVFKTTGSIVGMVSTVGPLKGCGLLLLGINGSDERAEGTLAVKIEEESEEDYLLIVSVYVEKVKTIRSSNTVCLFIQKLIKNIKWTDSIIKSSIFQCLRRQTLRSCQDSNYWVNLMDDCAFYTKKIFPTDITLSSLPNQKLKILSEKGFIFLKPPSTSILNTNTPI